MAVVTTNLGVITAYGDAVAAGYRGTKAEWQALMANYATVGQQAAQDAQTASQAAQTATTKAGEASQSADRAEQAAESITTPDTTLTQAGVAADAKATGDEISDLKEGLSAMSTATSSDVGKALKAKTVTDGKVTEWEFGEAGASVELDATLTDPTKAAQAKVVGDAISGITEQLGESETLTRAYLKANYKWKYGEGWKYDTVWSCCYDVTGYAKVSIESPYTYGNEENLYPNITFFTSSDTTVANQVSAIYLGNIEQSGWSITVDVPNGATYMVFVTKKNYQGTIVNGINNTLEKIKTDIAQNEGDITDIQSRMSYLVRNLGYEKAVASRLTNIFNSEVVATKSDTSSRRIGEEYPAWTATNDYHLVFFGAWVKVAKGARICVCGRGYYPSAEDYGNPMKDGSDRLLTLYPMQRNCLSMMDVPDDAWAYVYGTNILGGSGSNATENKITVTALYEPDDESASYEMHIKNAVFIDLTADFGSGCEPTAEGMKALLDGATDRYFSDPYNIFNSPMLKGTFGRTDHLVGNKFGSPDVDVDSENQMHINSVVNPNWTGWNIQRTYGLTKTMAPMPIKMHGIVETDGLFSVIPLYGTWQKYGNSDGALWGGHLAHFWNRPMTYRMTFMTSAENPGVTTPEATEDEFCIFAYSPDTFYNNPVETLNEKQLGLRGSREDDDMFNGGAYYGRIRLGADRRDKGFVFRAKELKCYGRIDMNGNDLTLNATNQPSSSSATGKKGMIRVGTNYLYICVADNTWKRIPLQTW